MSKVIFHMRDGRTILIDGTLEQIIDEMKRQDITPDTVAESTHLVPITIDKEREEDEEHEP